MGKNHASQYANFGSLLYFQKTNTNVIKEMNSLKGNISFF